VDTVVGTDADDTITALAVDGATSAAATTVNATDTISGGLGNDTLNITVDTTNNATIAATITGVEVVNINNTTATAAAVTSGTTLNAAAFVGATNVNQIGKSSNVSGLASTTTATLTGVTLGANKTAGVAGAAGAVNASTTASAQSVAAASTATSASIALSGVKGDAALGSATAAASSSVGGAGTAGVNATVANEAVLNVSGASLNSVTVSGTLAKNTGVTDTANLALNVTGGASAAGVSVAGVSVNSAVKTTLTVTKAASSTGEITSVDASASAGAIKYVAASTVGAVKTGAGADAVTIQTATVVDNIDTAKDETLSASLNAGAGKDTVVVNTTGLGSTTVDGGADDDKITLTGLSAKASVTGGAGDDTVLAAVATFVAGVSVSGGEGIDTLSLSNSTFTTANYLSLDAYTSSFEAVTLTGDDVVVDASKLRSEVVKITLSETASTNAVGAAVTGIDGEAIVLGAGAKFALTSLGYDATNAGTTGTVYGSSIAATLTATGAVTANASALSLAVATVDGGANVDGTLAGDVKTASVALVSSRDTDSTTGVSLGTENVAKITIDLDANAAAGDAMTLNALTAFTVTGAGQVVVDAANGSTSTAAPSGKLDLIDLSGMTALVNLDVAGDQVLTAGGFGYENLSTSTVTLNDTNAEVLKLGGGDDTVTTASTLAKMDTIEGYQLTALASSATTVDAAKSDALDVAGITLAGATDVKAITISSSASTLAGALLEAGNAVNSSGTALNNVVFKFNGDTYFYSDDATAGYSDNDVVIKFVGDLNLALLAQTIA
jgi:hypothetical protein